MKSIVLWMSLVAVGSGFAAEPAAAPATATNQPLDTKNLPANQWVKVHEMNPGVPIVRAFRYVPEKTSQADKRAD